MKYPNICALDLRESSSVVYLLEEPELETLCGDALYTVRARALLGISRIPDPCEKSGSMKIRVHVA